MNATLFSEQSENPPNTWRVWLIAFGVAAALHFLLLMVSGIPKSVTHSPPAEVHTIDARKLEAIRNQWKKSLLINKDPALPKNLSPSPDARYLSDRNIRVKKEQRARQTNVVPQPSHLSAAPDAPDLKRLGVPLKLGAGGKRIPSPKDGAKRGTTHNAQGGDQAISDRALPEGSENLLNAQESVYYSFYARLYEAIGPVWQSLIRNTPHRRPVRPGDYTTVVDVVFDSAGKLLAVNYLTRSGVQEFDAAVDSSWRKIGRFPNPPRDLLNAQGHVHMGWSFSVHMTEGFQLQYLPPERNY